MHERERGRNLPTALPPARPMAQATAHARALLWALAAVVCLSLALSPLASVATAQVNAAESTAGEETAEDGEASGEVEGDTVEVRTCGGETTEISSREAELLALHNEARQAQDLDYLCLNPTLGQTASGHAADMLERGYFAHDNLDGENPIDRAKAAGYPSEYVGENIAYTEDEQADAADTVSAWLGSEGHRENIQNGEYLEVGFGSVSGSDEGVEAVEGQENRTVDVANFGKREAQESGRDGASHAYPEVLSGASPESRTDGAVDERAAKDEGSADEGATGEGTSAGDQYATGDSSESPEFKEGSGESGSGESSSGDEGQGGQSVVQISQNGETKTLEGEEARAEICARFAETREEVITGLREGTEGDDPASEVKNRIADDFEESFLNPDSCDRQGGEEDQQNPEGGASGEDSADGGSPETGATEDTATEEGTTEEGERSGTSEQEPEVIVTPEES